MDSEGLRKGARDEFEAEGAEYEAEDQLMWIGAVIGGREVRDTTGGGEGLDCEVDFRGANPLISSSSSMSSSCCAVGGEKRAFWSDESHFWGVYVDSAAAYVEGRVGSFHWRSEIHLPRGGRSPWIESLSISDASAEYRSKAAVQVVSDEGRTIDSNCICEIIQPLCDEKAKNRYETAKDKEIELKVKLFDG